MKASTTDKLLLFATNGKFFTLAADQLPGGRGHGEPVRLMVDLEENHEFVELFVHEPGRKLLVAATSGHGFIVPEDEVVALTRKGKQVMNVDEPEEACCCVPADGDMVACIGENRKMLIFPLDEVNEMTRGKGIILQRFKDGGLSDVRVFAKKEGLTWLDAAGRTFTLPMAELRDWIGQRAQAGRLAPRASRDPTSSGPPSDRRSVQPSACRRCPALRIGALRAMGRCNWRGEGARMRAGVWLMLRGLLLAPCAGPASALGAGRHAARPTSRR